MHPSGRCSGIVVSLVVLAASASQAGAQNIIPGAQPDVILTCMTNDRESAACVYVCHTSWRSLPAGQPPPTPPEAPPSGVKIQNVSRIEFYHHRGTSQTGERFWFAARKHATEDITSVASEELYYFGSTVFCDTTIKAVRNPNTTVRFRIDKFSP